MCTDVLVEVRGTQRRCLPGVLQSRKKAAKALLRLRIA
jgi:hypothetical protein